MFQDISYIDVIIALIFFFYIAQGIRRGFFVVGTQLASFLGALVAAFFGYQHLGRYIVQRVDALPSVVYALSFISIFILVQVIITFLLHRIIAYIPESWRHAAWANILAVVPAAIDGLIFLSIMVLLVAVLLPIPHTIRNDVTESNLGGAILENVQHTEQYFHQIFGGAIEEALTFLTIRPQSDERITIPYRPRTLTVDREAELRMLELVNQERARVGAPPLVEDETLTRIARAHSRDMWERGYFSHTNPDGADPFDRMRAGGAQFVIAGENLALAPSVGFAHRGLMNSPGHRRNILDPRFGRVGIGVIDGGVSGQMYTQNFAN